MEMNDLEKVIKGLYHISNDTRLKGFMTYWGSYHDVATDAIALLKVQEPRLLTYEDFNNNPAVDSKGRLPAWVEHNWKLGPSLVDDGYSAITKEEMENWDKSFVRWWTSRPTKAQTELEPWE